MTPPATVIPPKARLLIDSLAARLDMINGKLKRARRLSSQLEELVDDAASHLEDLCGVFGPSAGSLTGSDQVCKHLTGTQATGRISKQRPQEVGSVILSLHGDRSATARFDDRAAIALPPLVAALLEILKADDGVGRDHLVGWKSVDHIHSALKERTKQQPGQAAIKQLVYRLRRLLESHGESPFLVQQDDRLGYRFAVRYAPGAAAERDNQ